MQLLKKILEESCKNQDLNVIVDMDNEYLAKFGRLEISIEPMDQDLFPDLKGHVCYNIQIGPRKESQFVLADIEAIIAKANWFVSHPRIITHVLDMPDGMYCNIIVEVAAFTRKALELLDNIKE